MALRRTIPDEVERPVSEPDRPNLDDVMTPTESAPRDRQQHAGGYTRSDDELQHRTEHERQTVDSDDADPAGADVHSATD